MDILEDAIIEAKELFDQAVKLTEGAGQCEVSSFMYSWGESYPNHYLEFGDGMGQKSFDIYRKHDNKLRYTIIYDQDWSPKDKYNTRHTKDIVPVAEVIDFMKELDDALDTAGLGYIALNEIKHERFE